MSTEKPDNETGQETTTSVASKIAALETCQPSHAPPNTPRKTSTRKSQSIMRKFTLVADALSGQNQDLPATLPKPNNNTGVFCDIPPPPPRPPKYVNRPIPPPRPYSATKTAEDLLDFGNGCDFCGKPDDDDTDAAFCRVCQQYNCLVCLKYHQKCNSTKDHEIKYKLGTLPKYDDDDEMSIIGMSDEYKSPEKAADRHKCDLSSENERSGSNNPNEDQFDNTIMFCDLCDSVKNIYIEEAVADCKECGKKMCIKCLKDHQLDKNKQHHVIDNFQHMDKFQHKIKCKLHPEWSRMYFCKKHMEIICVLCRVDRKHEDCKGSIVELRHASKEQNIDRGETNRKLHELRCLSNGLSGLQDTVDSSLKDIGKKKRDFKTKIKTQQRATESQLNLAATAGINILDDQLELLKHKANENQEIKYLLQKQISEFDELLKSGPKEKIYIKQTSVETAVLKFRTILEELQLPLDIDFKIPEKSSEVDGLIKDSDDAKGLIVKEKLTIQRPILDREAVLTNEVILSNFKTTNVVGMEFLHEEILLVCNNSTNELAMFDNSFKLMCTLKVKSAPTSMAVISNGNIIVALPTEKCLQHVNVSNKETLSLVKTVKTKLPCLQICTFKMDLVAVVKGSKCNCIVPLDINGAFRTSIFTDKDGILKEIQCMTANQAHNIIYITDQDKGCIGISTEGNIVFKYKADSVQVYTGICIDYCGNVYLSKKNADKVVVMKNNGEKVKNIVTMKGLLPHFIQLNHTYDKLVIQSSNKIKVFKLI